MQFTRLLIPVMWYTHTHLEEYGGKWWETKTGTTSDGNTWEIKHSIPIGKGWIIPIL